jgi:hypothetical protein
MSGQLRKSPVFWSPVNCQPICGYLSEAARVNSETEGESKITAYVTTLSACQGA